MCFFRDRRNCGSPLRLRLYRPPTDHHRLKNTNLLDGFCQLAQFIFIEDGTRLVTIRTNLIQTELRKIAASNWLKSF